MTSSQPLRHTSINLILYERLSAHQEERATRQLSLKPKRPVIARSTTGEVVAGYVDYVLGYEAADGPGNQVAFVSTLAVVVVKYGWTFESKLAQCFSYLGTAPKVSFIFVNWLRPSGYPSRERRSDPEEHCTDRIWDRLGWCGLSVPASQRQQTECLLENLDGSRRSVFGNVRMPNIH